MGQMIRAQKGRVGVVHMIRAQGKGREKLCFYLSYHTLSFSCSNPPPPPAIVVKCDGSVYDVEVV